MQSQLIKKALVSLLSFGVTTSALGQNLDSALATVADNSDEPSGWVRIEIAIFVDLEADALAAETWEREPVRSYPPNRRWLTRYDEIKGLMDQWGESAVTIHPDGSIDVIPKPTVEPDDMLLRRDKNAVADAADTDGPALDALEGGRNSVEPDNATDPITEQDRAYIADVEATNETLSTVTDETALLDQAEPISAVEVPARSVGSSRSELQVSMDELSDGSDSDLPTASSTPQDNVEIGVSNGIETDPLTSDVDTAAIDAVDIFNPENLNDEQVDFNELGRTFADEGPLPGADIDWLNSYVPNDTLEEGQSLSQEAAPPALPAPYQQLPIEMLEAGLVLLQQQAERVPINSMAWLQPPGDGGTPVVIDTWQNQQGYPVIQGTLTFSRSDKALLNIDAWLNTQGDYLPPQFSAISVVSLPERILVIEPPPVEIRAVEEQERPEFIDLATGLNSDGTGTRNDAQSEQTSASKLPLTPYRHAIGLSEQRDMREGYVRYIDHPALQVIAAWRELSFSEVYELGENQRIRRDIDSLTRTLTQTSVPGGAYTSMNEIETSDTNPQ